MKVLGWLEELGMTPIPNVILGFPGETKESAWKTIKFRGENISSRYRLLQCCHPVSRNADV